MNHWLWTLSFPICSRCKSSRDHPTYTVCILFNTVYITVHTFITKFCYSEKKKLSKNFVLTYKMIFSLWPKYLIFVFCLCPSISEESGLTPQHMINTVIEMAWYFNLHDGNRFQFSDKIRFAIIQWHFSIKTSFICKSLKPTSWTRTVPRSHADPLPLKHIQTEKRSIGKINFDRGQFRDLSVSVEKNLLQKIHSYQISH